MLIGKVVGSVVSTRKNENLIGNKFMIVEILKSMDKDERKIVAIDNIGAGVGEVVLVATGLSKINDRIRKIKERIEEIEEKQKVLEDDNELDDVDISQMKSKIERKTTTEDSGNIDIQSIFGKYGI